VYVLYPLEIRNSGNWIPASCPSTYAALLCLALHCIADPQLSPRRTRQPRVFLKVPLHPDFSTAGADRCSRRSACTQLRSEVSCSGLVTSRTIAFAPRHRQTRQEQDLLYCPGIPQKLKRPLRLPLPSTVPFNHVRPLHIVACFVSHSTVSFHTGDNYSDIALLLPIATSSASR